MDIEEEAVQERNPFKRLREYLRNLRTNNQPPTEPEMIELKTFVK